MKRSFERILKKFSFSSVYDSDASLPPVQGIPRHKLLPKTAPGKLATKTPEFHKNEGRLSSLRKGHESKKPPSAAATCSWKKIKVTLPRCEADELTPATLAAERANPLASHEGASSVSLLGLSRRTRKSQECSGFMVPACVATKPMPRARDRYIQSLQQKVSLCDIKECAYLRISTDLRTR